MTTSGSSTEETRSKADRLIGYLRRECEESEIYVKSKFIAEDVGLSPYEIGSLMTDLQDSTSDLSIEKWSYTRATTWRISKDGQ